MVLVSVVIPVFNREKTILQTLNSVLEQEFENWECLVVDDGSSDDSVSIITKVCERDKRVRLIERPANRNKGASCSRNIGLEHASGKYIQFLDSDDLLAPNKLQVQVNKLESMSGALALCPWSRFRSDEPLGVGSPRLNCIDHFKPAIKILSCFGQERSFTPLHSFLIPSSIIVDAGRWDEGLTVNDDGEFMTRIFLRSECIVPTLDTQVYYRSDSESKLSNLNSKKQCRQAIKSWKQVEKLLEGLETGQKSAYLNNAKWELFKTIPYRVVKLENWRYFKPMVLDSIRALFGLKQKQAV